MYICYTTNPFVLKYPGIEHLLLDRRIQYTKITGAYFDVSMYRSLTEHERAISYAWMKTIFEKHTSGQRDNVAAIINSLYCNGIIAPDDTITPDATKSIVGEDEVLSLEGLGKLNPTNDCDKVLLMLADSFLTDLPDDRLKFIYNTLKRHDCIESVETAARRKKVNVLLSK